MSNTEVETNNIQNLELATGFNVGSMVIATNLEGITNEEALVSPQQGGNCINWVAGHLLMARGGLLQMLGGQPPLTEEETKLYGGNSANIEPGDAHIPLDVLRKKLQEAGESISAKLNELPPEKLREDIDESEFPVKVVGGTHTLGTLISEMLYHDGYHGGQLGLLRRVLGKKGQI